MQIAETTASHLHNSSTNLVATPVEVSGNQRRTNAEVHPMSVGSSNTLPPSTHSKVSEALARAFEQFRGDGQIDGGDEGLTCPRNVERSSRRDMGSRPARYQRRSVPTAKECRRQC